MRALVRLIAAVLGLAVAFAGALLAIEVLWAWLNPNDDHLLVPWHAIRADLETITWNNTWVWVTAIIVAVVGLLLLLISGCAGRKEIRLHDPAPEVTVTTTPSSLGRFVGHHVRVQHGVASASVKAGRNRVKVKAKSEYVELGNLRAQLEETVTETVRELPLRKTPKVKVSARQAKERR